MSEQIIMDLPMLAKWLAHEQKEIVTKEDLKSMLECVKACCIEANKIANKAVESANRLSEIYERYSNEDRT